MAQTPITNEEALNYHEFPQPGKIALAPTKPFCTQRDLSLAYTPGVAVPCLEIEKDPEAAYRYTSKSNLVGVISNGTAVLGLGNIGALASKPVMEGKAVLFKAFSDLDAFDIEVDVTDVDKFCEAVEAIAPTFGGINLEDIKAPECFAIEERLDKSLPIPVMHDDQHGTAVVSSAAMINACEITGRTPEKIKVVIVGAGAAAISCAKLYRHLGVKALYMVDSKGVIHKGRNDLNPYKMLFAADEVLEITDVFKDADMVVGLSRPGTFGIEHVALMAKRPLVFTLANPTPELFPHEVRSVRPDAVIATGRSDYPNQINNVLAFPFIFRGAVDVHAKEVNIEMKIAAAKALAALARKEVPAYLDELYGTTLTFGKEYVLPKPFDRRLIVEVSAAVAEAAIASGASPTKGFDLNAYKAALQKRSDALNAIKPAC